MLTHLLAKTDLDAKDSGGSKTHYGLELSPDFDPQRAFLHMGSVSLAPRRGEAEIP